MMVADVVGYTLSQMAEILHCTIWEVKQIANAAGFELFYLPKTKEHYIHIDDAREVMSVWIPPQYFGMSGKTPARYLVSYFNKKRRREMKNLSVKRTKRSVIFKTDRWEVEARKEILKPSTWAIIFNGEFIQHTEAQTGEGAILKCFEVPSAVRAIIKKKMSKKAKK